MAGKIVYCSANNDEILSNQMMEINRTGAKEAIFATELGWEFLKHRNFFMPFVAATLPDGEVIEKYVTETPALAVDITFIQTELGAKTAPQVAYFSSRGPSRITPGILKPDELAPGVHILASWVPNRPFAPIGSPT